MRGRLGEITDGVRLVGAGFRLWRTSPRLTVIGLIPGVITALLLASAFVAVAVWVDDWARGIAGAVTHDPTPNSLLVGLTALAIIGGGALLGIYTFTALTLLIGQPFFETIANRVAPGAGLEYSAADEPWWRSTWRGIGEGIRLLALGVGFAFVMFLVGLVPVVGVPVAFCGSALFGGSLLSLELTAYPLARAGLPTLRERRLALRARRPLAMGFGVTAYLLCLIPLGAVIAMPALVAGGTLLTARIASERA